MLRTHSKHNGCAWPTCTGPADVEVHWIVTPGQPLHHMDGQILDPRRVKAHADSRYGARQALFLCARHAAEEIAGDNPPIAHRLVTKAPPRTRNATPSTPRFADDFGL